MSKSLKEYLSQQSEQCEKHTALLVGAYINDGYCPMCLLNYIANLEMDLNYLNAVLDGSWPSSVAILEKALEKAKQIKKEKENE